jgi:hypothetical protein
VCFKEVRREGVGWGNLAQDRRHCRAVVSTEWTFCYDIAWGVSLSAEGLLTSQEGLCSIKSVSYLVNCLAGVLPTILSTEAVKVWSCCYYVNFLITVLAGGNFLLASVLLRRFQLNVHILNKKCNVT